jgi:asparagine synthase (glutamine-hydrolysing)
MLDAGLPSAFDILRDAWPKGLDDPVEAAARYEFGQKMVNDFLWNEDRVSMAWGLEVRVPFLDMSLCRKMATIPRRMLMPSGRLKGMLREIAARWLPPEVLNRPKSGFQVPVHLFFNENLKRLAREYLSEHRLRDSGLFNYAFAVEVLRAKPSPRL